MTRKFIIHWGHVPRKSAGLSHAIVEAPDAQAWTPDTDVCEGPDEVVIRMELAAVPIENLEIYLEEQVVVIKGVREDTASEDSAAGYRFRQLEIEYGPFQRALPLPYVIDGDNAKAHMRNGMLEVRLPRAQVARHTTINVIVEP